VSDDPRHRGHETGDGTPPEPGREGAQPANLGGWWRGPVALVCPICQGTLGRREGDVACAACGHRFGLRDGIPDLIVGGRFDDPTDDTLVSYEEQATTDQVARYLLPLFRELWPRPDTGVRLLSLGCGAGIDVELLCEAGYDAVGIDCGNRSRVWSRRQSRDRLVLANGKHLPFASGTFDGIFAGCVFPHVGVVGDSFTVGPAYHEDRLRLAREMTRVLKRGGRAIVSSPNRRFPLDIFHGRTAGSYRPRIHRAGSPFLLSVGDYRRLFREAGCASVRALPVGSYWGFIQSRRSLKGFLLGLPIRLLFWLVSRPRLVALRGSALNPWIVVLIEREATAGPPPATERSARLPVPAPSAGAPRDRADVRARPWRSG
jgi:SAM-dependent methyltransferase